MSYFLFLLYDLIFFLVLSKIILVPSSDEKEEDEEEDFTQVSEHVHFRFTFTGDISRAKEYRFIIPILGLGIILGFWSLITFLFEGMDSIPTFIHHGFILTYMVVSFLVLLIIFRYFIDWIHHRLPMDGDGNADDKEMFQYLLGTPFAIVQSIGLLLGTIFCSVSSLIVIVMVVVFLFF